MEGEPAIVGKLALTDSCSLLARVPGGWILVGVAIAFDEIEEEEWVELRESTRRTVTGDRPGICIGGRLAGFELKEAVSSTEPSVCEG